MRLYYTNESECLKWKQANCKLRNHASSFHFVYALYRLLFIDDILVSCCLLLVNQPPAPFLSKKKCVIRQVSRKNGSRSDYPWLCLRNDSTSNFTESGKSSHILCVHFMSCQPILLFIVEYTVSPPPSPLFIPCLLLFQWLPSHGYGWEKEYYHHAMCSFFLPLSIYDMHKKDQPQNSYLLHASFCIPPSYF